MKEVGEEQKHTMAPALLSVCVCVCIFAGLCLHVYTYRHTKVTSPPECMHGLILLWVSASQALSNGICCQRMENRPPPLILKY